jgi:hypothetical protein
MLRKYILHTSLDLLILYAIGLLPARFVPAGFLQVIVVFFGCLAGSLIVNIRRRRLRHGTLDLPWNTLLPASIPADMRSRLIITPRDNLHQLVLVGCILGIGLSLTVIAFGFGYINIGSLSLPIAIGIVILQSLVLPWSERACKGKLDQWFAGIGQNSDQSALNG